jgi:hypothetical protein
MTTRAQAFAGPFPAGPDWVSEARSRLGLDGGDHEPVRAVAQGWMRLGSTRDATLVDTLFVLTDDQLGFGQTHFETTDPNWIDLSTVHAIDLIEGVRYPLEAIEVQFVGGLAIFVGWPEDFITAVLAVLRANGSMPTMAPLFSADAMTTTAPTSAPVTAPMSTSTPVPRAPTPAPPSAAGPTAEPDHGAPRSEVPPAGSERAELFSVDEPVDEPTEATDASDGRTPFDGVFSTEEPTTEQLQAEEAFFGDLEAGDEAVDDDEPEVDQSDLPTVPESAEEVTGPWDDPSIEWPDAFRDSAFLGGHPVHQRRRKNCTVVLERRGLVAAIPRSGGWHLHIPWHAVARLDVQGADEIKFTHNQRVHSDGSVLVADLADGTTLLFEIRTKRPAILRAAVAPIKDAINGV